MLYDHMTLGHLEAPTLDDRAAELAQAERDVVAEYQAAAQRGDADEMSACRRQLERLLD